VVNRQGILGRVDGRYRSFDRYFQHDRSNRYTDKAEEQRCYKGKNGFLFHDRIFSV
jgi:hypothetical protein